MNQKLGFALVSAAALATIATAAVPAQAGARSCHVLVCNTTEGSGQWVESITASLTYNSRFYGHFQIYGTGFSWNSSDQWWGYPDSWKKSIRLALPSGTLVCVAAWERSSSGGYVQRGNACNQIKS